MQFNSDMLWHDPADNKSELVQVTVPPDSNQ